MTLAVVLNSAQPLAAAMVRVTKYVPGVLAAKSIAPVVASMKSPVVELNVPPVLPVRVTVAVPTLVQ